MKSKLQSVQAFISVVLESECHPPDVADVGQQQSEVSQAEGLLLGGQAQLGDGPDQGVDDRVEQAQQFTAALQLLGRLRGTGAKICRAEQRHTRGHRH